MLILFDLPKDTIHAFKTYYSLYNHLEHMEKTKGKGKWVFARHSHQHVLACYRYIRNQKLSAQPARIFEQGLERALKQATAKATGKGDEKFDILEMVNGNVKKPVFIPVTPDIDIITLQQRWCQNYCKKHGYALFEVSSPTDFKNARDGHDYAIG